MMSELEGIKQKLREHKPELKEKYNVKEISIFGSYIRGDETNKSDLDILVDFTQPIGLIKFIGLEEELEDILGINIDLVPKKGIKVDLKESILKEAVEV